MLALIAAATAAMPPRTKKEPAEPTRRSTRISAQPKSEHEPEPVKKAAAPKASKKRVADDAEEGEGGEEAPAVKKASSRASFRALVRAC